MKRALLILALVITAAPLLGAPGDDERAYRDKYNLLTQRNVFLRNRTRATSRPTTSPAVEPPRLERSFVLRGIVREGAEYVAFIEDMRGNGTLRLRIGEAVATGSVVSIDLNSIEYRCAESKTRVEIGATLAGGEQVAAATSQPSTVAGSGTDDILERMRRRRLEEMKKQP